MGKLARDGIVSLSILAACVTATGVAAQDVERGKRLFTEAEPPCALCHKLKAASSTGEVGPNLDDLKPDMEKIRRAVKNGVGAMPPYEETLSDADIEAVAAFVAGAVGTTK